MPERLQEVTKYLNSLPPEFAGVLMAMFVSVLRVIYDEEETRWMRTLLESAICGALALTVNSGVIALGFGHNWAVFIGGTVGYFGSAKVRCLALYLVSNKLGVSRKKKSLTPLKEDSKDP